MAIRRSGFKTNDSALAYFVNQLDNLDKALYEPLVSVSWGRDIMLRPGISMSNESTSFIRSAFAAPGSLANSSGSSGGNMPFLSAESTAIPGIEVNGERIVLPLRLLGRELSYTSVELDRSQLTQQPIDVQKMAALNTVYQMNTDQMVYIGASEVGATGLLNSSLVTAAAVANGISGSPLWTTKTADEILADVNTLLNSTWAASAYAVSILKFLKENSIALNVNGKELEIQPVKWLVGRGVGPTDRMMAYTNDLSRVRFPMVPVRRETAYYQGIRFTAPYIWAFGEMEFVYPETCQYADGI